MRNITLAGYLPSVIYYLLSKRGGVHMGTLLSLLAKLQ